MSTAPAAPERRTAVGAIVALVIGAILTIAGPVLGVLAGSLAVIPGALETAARTIEVSPSGEVSLDAGESLYLLAPVADLERVTHQDCTASDSRGGTAPIAFAPASALNTLVDGERYESFARLTAASAGPQLITCRVDGVPVVGAPPFAAAPFFGPLLGWSVGGIAVAVVGVALVIVGIVRLARRL